MDVLSLYSDIEESRNKVDHQRFLRSGKLAGSGALGWDIANSINVWVDAVTYTAMLQPYCTTPEWYGSSTGNYRRFRQADYNIAASMVWKEHKIGGFPGVFLFNSDGTGPVETLETLDANTGMYFALYGFGSGDRFVRLEVQRGNVSQKIFSDGACDVYKDGVLVGSGNIAQLDDAPRGFQTTPISKVQSDTVIEIVILPIRGRELLIISSLGGGFSHVFDDIDEEEPSRIVLPSAKLRWSVPSGTACVQAAPIKLATSGTLYSPVLSAETAPPTGAGYSTVLYGQKFGSNPAVAATASLTFADGTTDFVGNNSTTDVRIKVALSGTGKQTPFIYGVAAQTQSLTALTPADNTDITDLVTECRLSVPDTPSGVSLNLKVRTVEQLESRVTLARRISNRTVGVTVGSLLWFRGRSQAPQWTDAAIVEGNEALTRQQWEWRDQWVAFENYRIRRPIPFAGWRLTAAFKWLARLPGYADSDIAIDEFNFTLPGNNKSDGEWDLMPEDGDTVAQWILRLWEDWAQNSVMSWVPTATTPKFTIRRKDALPITAGITLWRTIAEARAGLIVEGYSEEEADAQKVRRVYRSFDEKTLPPEANDIHAGGYDRETGAGFYGYWIDPDSQVPDTATEERTERWQGEPIIYRMLDPAITRLSAAEWAAAELGAAIGYPERTAEWECDWLLFPDNVPFWRGDVVNLDGMGRYRIETYETDFKKEVAGGTVWRPSKYTGVYIGASEE